MNRTHFLYRVDMWTIDGKYVIEHLAGVEDAQLAMATYQTACKRWPGTVITLPAGGEGDRGQSTSADGVVLGAEAMKHRRGLELAAIFALALLAGVTALELDHLGAVFRAAAAVAAFENVR